MSSSDEQLRRQLAWRMHACNAAHVTHSHLTLRPLHCLYTVCSAGYGGTGCGVCQYDTFSFGTLADGDDCVACATGSVSARGAVDSSQCYPALISPSRDVFVLSDETAWADVSDPTTGATCGAACATAPGCLMYRFHATSRQCQHLQESPGGAVEVGFKVADGVDFVLFTLPAGLLVGTPLGAARTVADRAACMAACKANANCEVASLAGSSCTLATSELDADNTAMFHVVGSRLQSDALQG